MFFVVEFSSATFDLSKLFSKFSYEEVTYYLVEKSFFFVTKNEVL